MRSTNSFLSHGFTSYIVPMQKNTKNKFVTPLLAAAMVAGMGAGAITMSAHSAAAADTTSTAVVSTSNTTSAGTQMIDPKKGGHVGANGTKEVLLTGDTAAKVTAAALAAVPGGTIERVENDAEGATYEAHMTKADGSHVTVKFDSNFAVTTTETGHGGPRGAAQ